MAVKRIVADIATENIAETRAFYSELFGLETVMDQGWVVTLTSGLTAPVQITLASEGGSGAPVPDLSIEVDDLEEVYRKAKARGAEVVYEITREPWGVRRFFIRDPGGKLLNVMSHENGS